jgi:propionyl-CoA carboxylase alpha chain
VQRRN